MTFASSFALVTSIFLAAGCASSAARPVVNAGAERNQPPAATQIATRAPERTVELRHFYLLSPGPNATLVVTRSDVPAPAP